MIRLQQTLGYTLGEILALNEEYRAGEHSSERTAEVLQKQIARLEERKAALDAALSYGGQLRLLSCNPSSFTARIDPLWSE
jgi:DNA-binding transcriptional MerR regulator